MDIKQFVNSQAQTIHKDWIETILDCKQSGSITGVQMFAEHLHELHERATDLHEQYQQYFNPITIGMIKHIVGRSADDHIRVIRAGKKNLVSTF